MKKNEKETGYSRKLNPKTHRLTVRFDDEEYDRMLRMYEKSGCYAKAVFIKEMLFGRDFKVTIVDNTVPEYYAKLSDFHAQLRRIGNNYNQVTKELKFRFSEKKAMALLYKLEQETRNLVMVGKEITALTKRYEQVWLPK